MRTYQLIMRGALIRWPLNNYICDCFFNVSTSLPYFEVGARARDSGSQEWVFVSPASVTRLVFFHGIGHEGGQGRSDKDHM